MFMTFYGRTRADHHTYEHAHESPYVMLVPLFVLAAGAIFAGFLFKGMFVGDGYKLFWGKAIFEVPSNHIMHAIHEVPAWVAMSPFFAMLGGFALSYVYYIHAPWLPEATATAFRPLYLFLLNKWYFDELDDRIFVRPAMALGKVLWQRGDGAVIDGAIDGTANRVLVTANNVARLQTGYIYHYAFAMLIGLAALITWFMLGTGGVR
jgi:NADH-quinone oxidoreductase subunit L